MFLRNVSKRVTIHHSHIVDDVCKGKGKEAEQSKPMGGPAMAKPAADKPGDKPGQGRAGGKPKGK